MDTKLWSHPAAEAWRMSSIATLNQAVDPYILTDTELQRELAIFANAQFPTDSPKSDGGLDKSCDGLASEPIDFSFLMKPTPPTVLNHEGPMPLDRSASSSTVASPNSPSFGEVPWMEPFMSIMMDRETAGHSHREILPAKADDALAPAVTESPVPTAGSGVDKELVAQIAPTPTPTPTTTTTTIATTIGKKKANDPEYVDDKRRRNTAASARFRVKKKMREQAMQQTACEMTDKANRLEARVQELEREIQWLKSLIVEQNEVRLEKLIKERPTTN
ncbi:hypothetical protein DFQ28_000842 [Apophysomyces sp. BC1034]|nr:hypothetical protein DFQ30_004426 [Apophysomyces sp. BC1015]KAG0181109.1 hypothetical protein DFQ29_009340 [Apophysomyces sp. BC1021]KAG0191139.1 hypothetical protein DFQ28_000842 [Apophysomyces sp. BC1034]